MISKIQYTKNNNETGIIIQGVYPVPKELVIPPYIEHLPVQEIAPGAFINQSGLEKVILPETLIYIGNSSFQNCDHLQEIQLPKHLHHMGDYAFEHCQNLRYINLPASLTEIGVCTFAQCKSLAQIDLEEGIPDLGESTFVQCESLYEVHLPDSIQKIGFSLFWHCKKLTTVTGGKQVEAIYRDAFSGCISLNKINLSNMLCQVYRNAFAKTKLLFTDDFGFVMVNSRILIQYTGSDAHICIPDGITVIAEGAFANQKNIRSVAFPASLLGIGPYAFQNCDHLKHITGSPFLRSLEHHCFLNCERLANFYFPDSLTVAGEASFRGCRSLQTVRLSQDMKEIADYMFKDCESLQKVYFPSGLRCVGISAFEYCKNISSVALPSCTEHIRASAFYGCESLQSFRFPLKIKQIGEEAFGECEKLTDISTHKWFVGKNFLGLKNSTDITFLNEDGSPRFSVFYADDWHRFQDIPSRDRLTFCFHQAPEKILFSQYDTCLYSLTQVTDRIDFCMHRLMSPVELSERHREQFRSFIKNHPSETTLFVLKKEKPSYAEFLCEQQLFTESGISEAIRIATNANQSQYLIRFMDYKKKNFSFCTVDNLFIL